mmetsp:Transcript_11856/g.44142  ORF Transcript_11856/g.44142 Transcript_11856/m.44142 type:complete len:279 (-) Transcript_11856:949-1785(-)
MAEDAYAIPKRSKSCLTCGHKHLMGVPCPVFVFVETRKGRLERKRAEKRVAEWQAPLESSSSASNDPSDTSKVSSASATESSDDDDLFPRDDTSDVRAQMMDRISRGVQKARGAAAALEQASRAAAHQAQSVSAAAGRLARHKLQEMKGDQVVKRFVTPEWAKKCQFKRCNCLAGVDNGDPRTYEPLLLPRFVADPFRPEVRIEVRMEAPPAWRQTRKVLSPPAEVLDLVFPFLDARTCGLAASVSSTFADRVRDQWHYADMLYLRDAFAHKVHKGRV